MHIPSPEDFAHQVSDAGVGDSHNIPVYILLFGSTIFVASALWPLIRSRYPCITIAGLEAKEQRVLGLLQDAVEKGILVGPTMQIMEAKQIDLEYRASQIRTKNLEMTLSIWFIYLGFHPQLVPTLSTWYNDADILEQDIQLNPIPNAAAVENSKGVPGSQGHSLNAYNMKTTLLLSHKKWWRRG